MHRGVFCRPRMPNGRQLAARRDKPPTRRAELAEGDSLTRRLAGTFGGRHSLSRKLERSARARPTDGYIIFVSSTNENRNRPAASQLDHKQEQRKQQQQKTNEIAFVTGDDIVSALATHLRGA